MSTSPSTQQRWTQRWHSLQNHPLSPWLLVAAAAALWVALYRNLIPLWDWVFYDLLAMTPGTRLAEALHFFFYDTVKIVLLIAAMIFVITVARSFISVERTRALLGGRRQGVGNVLAALLGAITPFCSCSSVPIFIGFVAAGLPLGVTLTFLIASPLITEVAVIMLFGLFGWRVALLYVLAGLSVALVAGLLLGNMKLERFVEPFVFETKVGAGPDFSQDLSWAERFADGWQEVRSIVIKIFPYLMVGIGIGAVVHGWVPEDVFVRYAGPDQVLAVPVAVLLGIPLYSNAAGILPLVEALHAKGMAMGTLLSFMMAVVALSLPSIILLRRVLKPQLIAVFVSVVAVGILAVGWLFNIII